MNNRINFQALNYITDQDALLRYADETPIIPKDLPQQMQDHYSQGRCVQNYAVNMAQQPLIQLPDTDFNIITIQTDAKNHAKDWLNDMDTKMIAVYSDAKQYMNKITAFDGEIEQMMHDLIHNGESGKQQFIKVITYWQKGANANYCNINQLIDKLNSFQENIAKDNSAFKQVDDAAINRYGANTGEMKQLGDAMNLLSYTIRKLNKEIVAAAIGVAVGILIIVISAIASFANILIALIGITITAAAGGLLALEIKERDKDTKKYAQAAKQYNQLQSTCTRLRVVGNQFNLLHIANSKSIESTKTIRQAWETISKNIGNIATQADNIIKNKSLQALVKKSLQDFVSDAAALKKAAQRYEENSILPVTTDQTTWNLLHSGRRRIPALPNHPIPMGEYLALVERKNLLGRRFGRHF